MALRTHPTFRLKGGWRHCRELQRRRKHDDARVRLRLKSFSVNRLARSQGLLRKLFSSQSCRLAPATALRRLQRRAKRCTRTPAPRAVNRPETPNLAYPVVSQQGLAARPHALEGRLAAGGRLCRHRGHAHCPGQVHGEEERVRSFLRMRR